MMSRKYFLALLIVFSYSWNTLAQQGGDLIGTIEKSDFFADPYKEWFESEQANYRLNTAVLNRVFTAQDGLEILIYMGTWCGDSRREVPRFLKMLDFLNFDMGNVHIFGLDREKKAPNYTDNTRNIEYVPTMIFLKNDYELGRIIETPTLSLEEDIRNILGYNHMHADGQSLEREIFKIVMDMPRFPGCEDKTNKKGKQDCSGERMLDFLKDNINYPEKAKQNGTEGTVLIQFIVDQYGNTVSPRVVKSLGDGCDEEAIRMVNLMNTMPEKWIPGNQRGSKVDVLFTLPIKFKL